VELDSQVWKCILPLACILLKQWNPLR
jgi:hypothetical protein